MLVDASCISEAKQLKQLRDSLSKEQPLGIEMY